jgi:hypothetical protein
VPARDVMNRDFPPNACDMSLCSIDKYHIQLAGVPMPMVSNVYVMLGSMVDDAIMTGFCRLKCIQCQYFGQDMVINLCWQNM